MGHTRTRSAAGQACAGCEPAAFTLLELMIVISMILILMSIAVPMYNQSLVQARESVLRHDLFTLRSRDFAVHSRQAKSSAVAGRPGTAGYMRVIPIDPMTSETNWEVVQEDLLMAVDQQEPGISDVHSASSLTSSDGDRVQHLVRSLGSF